VLCHILRMLCTNDSCRAWMGLEKKSIIKHLENFHALTEKKKVLNFLNKIIQKMTGYSYLEMSNNFRIFIGRS
jgi:hypothetical protein